MSPASGADMCRITVVGPQKRVDLALPGYIPFAELFPAVARYAGLDRAAAGEAAGAAGCCSGWARPPSPSTPGRSRPA